MTLTPPLTFAGLAEHFALIIDGLCQAVAARAPGNRAAAPLLVLVWSRLRRLARRFARLVEQAATGTVPRPRPRGDVAGAARRPARVGQRWPSGFAWLVRLVPEAASFGSQLRHMLLRPEMAALIAAAPQAGRMFGPLKQMLAVQMGTYTPRPARVRAAVDIRPPPRPALTKIQPEWARNGWPGYGPIDAGPRRRVAKAAESGKLLPALNRSD